MNSSELSSRLLHNNPGQLPGLVRRSLRKPSTQETNIKSIFSQSAPISNPLSTQYSSFSLSNSSSPLFEKKIQAHLNSLPGSSNVSETDVKISHLFTNLSEKKEIADSDEIVFCEALASPPPSPVQNGQIIFSSASINIPSTSLSSKSSSSRNRESRRSTRSISKKNEHLAPLLPEKSIVEKNAQIKKVPFKKQKRALSAILKNEERENRDEVVSSCQEDLFFKFDSQ